MTSDCLRRWRDTLGYAAAAAILAPFTGRMFHGLARSLIPIEQPLGEIAAVGLCGLGLVAAMVFLRPRLAHFRHLFSFPPTFAAVPVASLLALVGAYGLLAAQPGVEAVALFEDAQALAAGSLGFSILVVGGLAVANAFRRAPRLPEGRGTIRRFADLLTLEFSQVLRWAASESPIESMSDDLFGIDQRAERILETLRRRRPGANGAMFPQTVVVQGPYGSGKSSLVRLVRLRAEAAPAPRMLFVEMNCWGFESTIRAQEHVLAQCVDELHEVIDCTSLRSLPAQYAKALSTSAPGWLATLLDHLFDAPSPRDQIERFAPLLRRSKTQLVAVIEDTDRNGGDFDPSQIEAMLFHFRAVERMSFILTAGPLVRIEFPKIAERIEFLPRLPSPMVLALLDRARDYCRTSKPFVDLVNEEDNRSINRPRNLLSQAYTVEKMAAIMHTRFPGWADALGRLVAHPRQLKQLLNTFVNAWDTLRGEVDVDELLIISALRQAAPAAFTYLGVHRGDLRMMRGGGGWNTTDSARKEHAKLVEELTSGWKKIAAEADFDVEAVEILLNELMPSSNQVFGPKYYTHGNRIQSIVYRDGPDYWGRISAEALDPHELRDQVVLQAIEAVQASPDGLAGLVAAVTGSAPFAALLGFFEHHHRLLGANAPAVLSAVNQHYRQKYGALANDEKPLYQTIRNGLDGSFINNDAVVRPWLEREIVACFPGNLRFACDLYGTFARKTSFAGDIRQLIRREAETHFSGHPVRKFVEGFDPQYPWTFYHLLFAYGDEPADFLVARPADWHFLVPIVRAGLTETPDFMMPAALFAFGEALPGSGQAITHVKFREPMVTEFFGERLAEFYSLAARYDAATSPLKEKVHRRLVLSVEAAKAADQAAAASRESHPEGKGSD